MIQDYGNVLKDEVLLAKGNELGNGFAYHVTDIVIPELTKIVEEVDNPPKHKAIMAILDPFVKGLELSGNKILVKRIAKEVFSECEHLSNLKHATLAQKLFELGTILCIKDYDTLVLVLCLLITGENYLRVKSY